MRPVFYVLLGVLLVPTVGLVGDVVTDGKFKSTMSTGAPLDVASPDMVVNLNADMVDGVEGTDLYTKAEVDTLITAAIETVKPKQYYISVGIADGAAVLGICGEGFHMASLWEIADPSSLRYATEHPDGRPAPSGASGPPSGWWAWIRTAAGSFPTGDAGLANCDSWTSNSASDAGTIVSLQGNWVTPVRDLVQGTPWMADTDTCGGHRPAWCVED